MSFTRTPANPNLKVMVESVRQHPNISYVDAAEPGHNSGLDAVFPALVAAVIGFVAGYAWGQLVANAFWQEQLAAVSLAIGSTAAWLSYAVAYGWSLTAGAVRFRAEFGSGEEEPEPPRAMLRTADPHFRTVNLTSQMRSRLQTFGRFYPVIKTPAILAWTKSKRLTRTQIEEVRKYLVQIGAAVSKETVQGIEIELTEWGKAQLPLWAAEDFAGLIELSQSPPPSEVA